MSWIKKLRHRESSVLQSDCYIGVELVIESGSLVPSALITPATSNMRVYPDHGDIITQIPGSIPRVSDSLCLQSRPKLYVSNELQVILMPLSGTAPLKNHCLHYTPLGVILDKPDSV